MMAASRKSPLAPLAPLFYALNWVAFVGWTYVLFLLLSFDNNNNSGKVDDGQALLGITRTPVLVLEGICVVEVLRILLKDLPGNLVLGVILHAIRFAALLEVLPRAAASLASGDAEGGGPQWTWTVPAVLWSWAVTEVTRYPMYLFPSSSLCRSIRMVVPLVTFPIGAFSEFCGAYQVFAGNNNVPVWLRLVLVAMMLVNGVLGRGLAYPALLKKGLPVLGLVKEKPKIRTV